MNIVFMGTSAFAVPSLRYLLASTHKVVGVVTQPDRPRGRGRKLSPTPVKELALKHDLPITQPLKIKDSTAIALIKQWQPDLIVVVSYGQIIPAAILSFPRYGCINVHASLLPQYRGAAPIQRALMNGENITGVTTMFMDEGLDTGDIILQRSIFIEDSWDHGQLEAVLAENGAELLMETITRIAAGDIPRIKQDHSQASYAHRILAEDEIIDWSLPAVFINNQIRALSPSPGAWCVLDGYKTKIFSSHVVDTCSEGLTAQIVEVDRDSFKVQCGKGILEILEVQREGKKRMLVRDFLRGNKLEPGIVLTQPGG